MAAKNQTELSALEEELVWMCSQACLDENKVVKKLYSTFFVSKMCFIYIYIFSQIFTVKIKFKKKYLYMMTMMI